MSDITVNMDNLNTEEQAQLMALIKKANAPNTRIYMPKYYEIYYFIGSEGELFEDKNEGVDVDVDRFKIGNCFRTEAEAEFAIERLKVLHELNKFAGTKNAGNISYSLIFSTKNKIVDTIKQTDCITSAIWFDTIEDAKTAIKVVGEDRIKKYYFMMED